MSTAFLVKHAWRIPELLARAAVGDVSAMIVLGALGVTAVAAAVSTKK